MTKGNILIIDDEASICSSLKGILEDEGFLVKTAGSGEQGLELLKNQNVDLVLLDIWLPKASGIEILKTIKSMEESPQVVMISGHGTIETAVTATKLGAHDFLEKPLSLEKVILTVRNALRQKKLEEENLLLRERQRGRYYLIGESPSIQRLRKEIEMVAVSGGTVLIYGENGTGKELVARLIHQKSQRREKRFVEVNCSAVPDELMEMELFGYLKGAFPQATRDKKGKFLLAHEGSLFLDEVGDLSPKTQAGLLRAISERSFEPLGAVAPLPFEGRVMAATSKSLRDLVAKGRFREDLFFKLNLIPLTLPPLRERPEDIPLLIDHFLEHFAAEYGKKPKTMSPEAVDAFLRYVWPGNVSELMNVIERFVIMVPDDVIDSSHLTLLVETRELEYFSGFFEGREDRTLDKARDHFERRYIHGVLMKNGWDIARSASDLNIDEAKLREKIKTLNITFVS
ncbi:MAG: sigma-54-dependent Fis family transcriptional regulator [Candidatus Aminicenantes bacterium]|nr:sigma-54-dependent Fis family transcriptional regulator [Candidatus Aminicenantes bacterium]